MDPTSAALTAAGTLIVLVGLLDVFLTIFHPDSEGPLARRAARALWRAGVELAVRLPRARREILALAGPVMLLATLLMWVGLIVVGYALIVWPRLTTNYDVTPALGPLTFWDALYYSGVTFTTLGFGDITPLRAPGKLVAVLMGVSGFALMTSAIAYVINVYDGMEHRDRLTLRVLTESRGECDGLLLVVPSFREEGAAALAQRLETWARELRVLQEKLYRFQNIAFYLRSRPAEHDPEPMLEALADAGIAAMLLAHAEDRRRLRPAAEHLQESLTRFMRAVGRRLVQQPARAAMDRPVLTRDDERKVHGIWSRLVGELHLAAAAAPGPAEAPEAWALAARSRIFLHELEKVTRWRTMRAPDATEP